MESNLTETKSSAYQPRSETRERITLGRVRWRLRRSGGRGMLPEHFVYSGTSLG